MANKLYESSRAGIVEVANFPEYKHLVSALSNIQVEDSQGSYQVTVKKHDRLLVLSAMASKFLECDDFKDEARELIEAHNQTFNVDGDFLAEPEQTRTTISNLSSKKPCGFAYFCGICMIARLKIFTPSCS